MRATIRLLALIALAGAAACHKAPPPTPASTPLPTAERGPQPGLWVQRVADRHGVRTTRYCLDASASAGLAAFDRQLNGRCARHDMAQATDGSWHFLTECDMGPAGKVATEGVIRGDFSSQYVVEAHSQTIGAANPALNGPSRMLAQVKRLGDCPKDMKPGDAFLPDGSHASLASLAGGA